MTLDEIRALLRFKDDPAGNCEAVNDLLDEHIGHVAERTRELKKLQAQLKELRTQCDAAGAPYGILETLDRKGSGKPAVPGHAQVGGTHRRQ